MRGTGIAGDRLRGFASRAALLLPLLGGASGCAGTRAAEIVDPRELPSAAGLPSIDEVRDLGGGDVPVVGVLRPAEQDRVAVVGEALWVRGRGFGRQPTVTIGGRPAAVLSRTGDGGLLVRVPPGTPPGPRRLVVSQERGAAEAPISLRRYAAALGSAGGPVFLTSITGDGPTAEAGAPRALAVAGARLLQIGAGGRAAYVVDEGGALVTVELPAADGPAVVGRQPLGPGAVRALLAAPAAHRLVMLGEGTVRLVDTSSPLRPIVGAPRPLPPSVASSRIQAVAISPDGAHLALALADRNRVVLLACDRLDPSHASVAGDIALAPEVRAGVLVDLAFAHDAKTLWVLAGDTPDSAPVGPQPTQLFAVRLERRGAPRGFDVTTTLARTVDLGGLEAPAALAIGRALPLASGAAIRLPPEKATVYLAARARDTGRPAIFAVDAQDAAAPLVTLDPAVALTAVQAVDVTPDGGWVLGLATGPGGAALVAGRADGRPGPVRLLPLAGAPAGGAAGARAFVGVQP